MLETIVRSIMETNRFKKPLLCVLVNSREPIADIIGDIVVFYNSKNLNCIGELSLFKICSHIFMIFEVKLE